MIKRILSIGMIMTIMLLSISIVYAVEKQNGTTPVDNNKMIEYLNSDSKKRLLLRDNYGYMTCIEKFNSDVTFLYLLNMSDLFINSGTRPDKTKYMEVLINIIASYDLDYADDISKQKEMDNLKSFKDYALDCAEMGAQAISVMTGVSSSTTPLEEGISTAVDGLSVLAKNTNNWIESLSNLETVVQDYSAHSDFLELVAQKAKDSDLKEAAKTVKESLSKAIKIKLNTYSKISNENFKNYEEFFFSDGLFAAIKQTPDYASDESLKFFTECGEKVFVLKDAWDLGVSIGKMVGNVVAGGEDLINRVLEMMALHDISDILVNGLFEAESNVVSNIYNNNSDGVTNYINLSQYLIMTRIRGEYCLYSIVAKDAGLLSWFNKESQEDAKKWYDGKVKKLSAIQEELLAVFKVNDNQDLQPNNDISNTSNTYHNEEYGWSVDIPNEWNQYGIIKEEPDSTDPYWGNFRGQTYFIHKELHENYSGEKYHGWVMEIYAIPKTATEFNQSNGWHNKGGFLGENIDYNFFWEGPTDAQSLAPGHYSTKDYSLDSEGQRLQNEYRTLEKVAEKIRDSFKIENEVQNTSKAVSSSDKPIEVRDNDTYSFSGKVVSDSETTPGRVYYYLLLDAFVKCKIYYSSSYFKEVEVDSIQITTGNIVNLDDYVNKNISVTGRFWLNGGSGGFLRKDIGLLVDEIK